ncbi:MAG: hypothetical protein QOF78_3981 [Phycisphaerales bacterium]|jgi:Ni/Co efflux regulator RcnB|nr:hypothetical protein [Phycisphaerales bacterium]
MRQASIALLAAIFLAVVTIPAAAQTTKPPADLAKENAELRAYADKLESRIAELEARVKEQQKKPAPRVDARPFIPAPFGYELPHPPFRLPPAPIQPRSNLRVPAPGQAVPDTWRRHEFNGQEFYLIPLR